MGLPSCQNKGTSLVCASCQACGAAGTAGAAAVKILAFSAHVMRGSSEAGRKATPEYVFWNVVASPQDVKFSFFAVLSLLRTAGNLIAAVSTFLELSGTLLVRPARGTHPPV